VEVTWAASAEIDLQQIHAYVAAENPAAARMLAEAIITAANSLAAFPLKGRAGAGGTREWVVPQFRRYLLIYDVDVSAGNVRIVRVWHQSRDR
jgi:plasmid stabilization system protein ParE